MKNKLLILSIFITALWMVIIFCFSSAPSYESNSGSKRIIRFVVEKFTNNEKEVDRLVIKINKPFRKCAHGSVYFVLALFVNSIIFSFKNCKLRMCNLISIIFCFIYALSDEYHQTFVFGRSGQFIDVLIDTFGAILGCVIFNIIYKRIKYKKNVNS